MYCGQCGTPNPEDAGSCETCGAPLLMTTGGRTCSSCGASLGDHDRFCMTCGAQASESGADFSYDASDDFGEVNIDDIQLDELPDWLQGMAPQPPSQESRPAGIDQPTPDDLPDWLKDLPSDQAAGAMSPPPASPSPPQVEPTFADHQPVDQFSLVSDDDLPEWLRALSDEDGESQGAATPQPVSASPDYAGAERSTAVANLFEVPPVSRAWLTQGRLVDQAQVTAARQEFSPLEIVMAASAEQSGSQSIWDTAPVRSTANDEETRPFSIAPESSAGGRGRLIARLVILVLLVIVLLILAFVLIEGI